MSLADAASGIAERLEATHAAREAGLSAARDAIRRCANAIRAIHRSDGDLARGLLVEARGLLDVAESTLAAHPAVYYAGFLQDAQKEYAEACTTRALVDAGAVPSAGDLGVPDTAWLRGVAEAVGELRRNVLDRLRRGEVSAAESRFAAMQDIVDMLAQFDYPDAITGGLRRLTDVARAIVERTRGDLTLTTVQRDLAEALRATSR